MSLDWCHVVTCGATQRGQFDIHNRPSRVWTKRMMWNGWGNVFTGNEMKVMLFDWSQYSNNVHCGTSKSSCHIDSSHHIWHQHVAFGLNMANFCMSYFWLLQKDACLHLNLTMLSQLFFLMGTTMLSDYPYGTFSPHNVGKTRRTHTQVFNTAVH